jgi:hypothetical protein
MKPWERLRCTRAEYQSEDGTGCGLQGPRRSQRRRVGSGWPESKVESMRLLIPDPKLPGIAVVLGCCPLECDPALPSRKMALSSPKRRSVDLRATATETAGGLSRVPPPFSSNGNGIRNTGRGLGTSNEPHVVDEALRTGKTCHIKTKSRDIRRGQTKAPG